MDESDEGDGGSDAESIDLETGRPSKKKKGQRFFCTEFPPCKLSFTRSEHLARHIRYVFIPPGTEISDRGWQETYRRAPLPMSLFAQILSA